MKNKNEFLKMVLITFIITSGFIMLWNWKNNNIAEQVRISQIETVNLVKLNAKHFDLEYYRTNEHYQQAKINN